MYRTSRPPCEEEAVPCGMLTKMLLTKQQQTFKVWQPQRAARSKRPNTPSDGSKHNGFQTTNQADAKQLITYNVPGNVAVNQRMVSYPFNSSKLKLFPNPGRTGWLGKVRHLPSLSDLSLILVILVFAWFLYISSPW